MNKDENDDLLLKDLVDIYRKKESIRKTYNETREMLMGFERARRKRFRTWSISGISAAACIAAFIIFLLPSFQKATGDELFESYYQKFNVNLDTRAPDSNPELKQVIGFYEEGQSTEALEELEAMFVEDKSNPEYIFYKALFLLDARNYIVSYSGFESLIPEGGSYESHARWYMALINIREGNYPSAKGFLKELRKAPDSTYQEKAAQLRRKIRFRR